MLYIKKEKKVYIYIYIPKKRKKIQYPALETKG
nr:MAG TPA: hypothetical protein [Caudoviricetes sp.]